MPTEEIKNDEQSRICILDMAMGAIKERVDYDMAKIVDNILDVNTPAKQKRKLTISIELLPDEKRQAIIVSSSVQSKLAPTSPINTMLSVQPDANGEVQAVELTAQTPGQINMFGGKQEPPKVLKLVR